MDALFHQTGVIRAETLGQLLDVASLLASQPPPRGRSVAIVTNAGGLGILCADACEAAGLGLPGWARRRKRARGPAAEACVQSRRPARLGDRGDLRGHSPRGARGPGWTP